jgi:hypothetical protein
MTTFFKRNNEGDVVVKNTIAWISLAIMILLPVMGVAVSWGLTQGSLKQAITDSKVACDRVNNHEVRITVLESDINYLKLGQLDIQRTLEKLDAKISIILERIR